MCAGLHYVWQSLLLTPGGDHGRSCRRAREVDRVRHFVWLASPFRWHIHFATVLRVNHQKGLGADYRAQGALPARRENATSAGTGTCARRYNPSPTGKFMSIGPAH